jgi:hypothetical protein
VFVVSSFSVSAQMTSFFVFLLEMTIGNVLQVGVYKEEE